ncbi:MAG: PD-(D/E)XK nuclease family protein, partial [Candidatus Nanohaloarchaea archaeon]|nr:PD-(D/E)XK nuclease family protein [Candidatus Nanohaloarchaea archaeon]
ASWTHEIPDRPWIDEEREEERNLERFKLMLQNGEQRHFMVQNRKMNREVSPCFYFNEITGKRFEAFDQDRELADYFHVERKVEEQPFDREDLDVKPRQRDAWSQSSLNKLYWCPRMYFFNRLIDDVDTFYKKRGTLFHDFAELYANGPEKVKERGMEEFLDLIMEEVKPFREDLQLDSLRTKFRIGLRTIMSYIDSTEIVDKGYEGFEKGEKGNFFADRFGIEMDASFTEMSFKDPELAVKGTVDLIISPENLLDFKTGRKKSEKKIVGSSNLEILEEGEEPEFQALLYLAHQRKLNPGERLEFIFLHVFEKVGDKLCGDRPMDHFATAEISYYPRKFKQHLLREETFDWLSEQTNALERALEPLGYQLFREFFKQIEFGDEIFDKEDLKEEHLEDLENHFRQSLEVGRGKDITENQLEKGADRILNYVHKLRNQNYFKGDVDRFEEFLQEQEQKFNQNYVREGFPVGKADLTARNLSHKDLIIND